MKSFNGAGARPCQLLDSAIFQAQTWLTLVNIRRQQVRLQFDLIAHSGRDKAPAVLFMAHSAFHSIVCSSFSSLSLLHIENLRSRTVSTISVWLPVALDVGIELSFSQAQPCSLSLARYPLQLSSLPSTDTCSTKFSLRSLAMVRQRMRSRHGGSRGGHVRS